MPLEMPLGIPWKMPQRARSINESRIFSPYIQPLLGLLPIFLDHLSVSAEFVSTPLYCIVLYVVQFPPPARSSSSLLMLFAFHVILEVVLDLFGVAFLVSCLVLTGSRTKRPDGNQSLSQHSAYFQAQRHGGPREGFAGDCGRSRRRRRSRSRNGCNPFTLPSWS